MSGKGIGEGRKSCHTEVRFGITICNHRAVITNIREIRLDGSDLDPPLAFAECDIPRGSPLGPPPDLVLPLGIEKDFAVNSEATAHGLWRKAGEVDLAKLKIAVVDRFGGVYQMGPANKWAPQTARS